MRGISLLAVGIMVFALGILVPMDVFAQVPPPPGTSSHDSNGDGTNDFDIRRLDTNSDGTTDRIHIDSNRNGVIDPGERVFDNVVGFSFIGGSAGFTITIIENTGTESIETKVFVQNLNADGDCSDGGEVRQLNFMPDSTAMMALRFPDRTLQRVDFNGQSAFSADLNRVFDNVGRDTIPIELVQLSLVSVSPITVTLNPAIPSTGQVIENNNIIPNNMDMLRFESSGTGDSFFDITFLIDLNGLMLFNQFPLGIGSLAGTYPPNLGQTFNNLNQVELFDLNTGQPTGIMIEEFSYTPHTTLRVDCQCNTLDIMFDNMVKKKVVNPFTVTVGKRTNQAFPVTITTKWIKELTCTSGDSLFCDGTYKLSAKSKWIVDIPHGKNKGGGTSQDAQAETFTQDGRTSITCVAKCSGIKILPFTSTYTAQIPTTSTNDIRGQVDLTMTPDTICLTGSRTLTSTIIIDTKMPHNVDFDNSDFDGDGKLNGPEVTVGTDPYDPDS